MEYQWLSVDETGFDMQMEIPADTRKIQLGAEMLRDDA